MLKDFNLTVALFINGILISYFGPRSLYTSMATCGPLTLSSIVLPHTSFQPRTSVDGWQSLMIGQKCIDLL